MADLDGLRAIAVLLVIVNDPDFGAPEGHPVAGRFDGNAMTFYGRWTYKFQEAARQGAAAVLVIHDTAGAGYGWSVLEGSSTAPKFDIVRANPDVEVTVDVEKLTVSAGAKTWSGGSQTQAPSLPYP